MTFKEFYKTNNQGAIKKVLENLFNKKLGQKCYQFSNKKVTEYCREFYNEVLPASFLVVETSPSPTPSIAINRAKKGDFISIPDCIVLEIKKNKLKVKEESSRIVIEYQVASLPEGIHIGQKISVTGTITDTREEKLKRIIEKLIAGLTDKEKLGHPNIPDLLNEVTKQLGTTYKTTSFIHGDLNVENILIDEDNNPWLIDFAKTRDNGPTSFDFIELEVDIKRHILSEILTLKQMAQIEKALICSTWGKGINRRIIPLSPKLRKAFNVIVLLRSIASTYIDKKEYFNGLFLYSIATLKFNDSTIASKKFAYISAAFALKRLKTSPTICKRIKTCFNKFWLFFLFIILGLSLVGYFILISKPQFKLTVEKYNPIKHEYFILPEDREKIQPFTLRTLDRLRLILEPIKKSNQVFKYEWSAANGAIEDQSPSERTHSVITYQAPTEDRTTDSIKLKIIANEKGEEKANYQFQVIVTH